MENDGHFGTNAEHAALAWNQTNTTSDIHCSPDGRFLSGSNRGHDSLVTFAIGDDGTLTLQGWTPTKGHHPRNFGVHPSGKWVLVLNADSDSCVLFACEPETGALTQTGVEFAWDGPTVVKWVPLPPSYHPPPRLEYVMSLNVKHSDREGANAATADLRDDRGLGRQVM